MSDLLIRSLPPVRQRWSYDDPSGVPDAPLEVTLPQPLRSGVETAAAREGVTPTQWLQSLVSRTLAPPTLKVV
jgi:hypothetical protein